MQNSQADHDNISSHIARFERLNKDCTPVKSTITKYQAYLDDISSQYTYDSSLDWLFFVFYELQALIYLAQDNSAKAMIFLNEAVRIKPVDAKFASAVVSTWYDKKMEQERVNPPNRAVLSKPVGRKRFGKKTKVFFWGVISTIVALAIFSASISDGLTIHNADPTMIKLAQDAGMTRRGELIFLRTHPLLVDDSGMAQYCQGSQENNNGFIEQGCFVPNVSDPTTGHIYIRKVPSDLYNVEVTTAAYEMLHPAYIGLSESSDNGVALNKSIEANRVALSDDAMAAQVANFAKTEPTARDLELFSIIGTEYSGISDDLAAYYAPYLVDINTVVSLNNQVNQLFESDEAQLRSLSDTIDTLDGYATTAYRNSVSWANAGSQYEDDYNYSIYQKDLDSENSYIQRYNTLLDQYNILVDEYNGQQFSPVSQPQAQ